MFRMLGAAVAAVVLSCAGAATWAMLIAGFGLAGTAIRGRRAGRRHQSSYGKSSTAPV